MRVPVSCALVFSLALLGAATRPVTLAQQTKTPVVELTNDAGSFKFAVLGNSGTGEKAQSELADQMAALHERFDYRTVLLLGGNIDGRERPQDFLRKFESPYRRLLEKGVMFRAVLGNTDSREQRYYKLFNMNGAVYYTFTPAPGVQLFALESTYVEPSQLQWLEEQLKQSSAPWKIAFLHHSPYSSGRRHGSDVTLRNRFEPLFVAHHVSVVFSAREHAYERITPQKGIAYFVVGAGGKVQRDEIEPGSGLTASKFDADLSFLAAQIEGDELRFNTISRTGELVDSGRVVRRK